MSPAAQICIACDQVFPAHNFARHCSPSCAAKTRNKRLWLEAKHPERKARAYGAYRLALKAGRLQRPLFCDRCRGAGLIHGHHEDYAKPLAVTWLCARCHLARHLGREDETLEFAV